VEETDVFLETISMALAVFVFMFVVQSCVAHRNAERMRLRSLIKIYASSFWCRGNSWERADWCPVVWNGFIPACI